MATKRTVNRETGGEPTNWRAEDAQKVIIEYGSKQWWAWDKYTRKTANPMGLPKTKFENGKVGWRCKGEWPPGHKNAGAVI
jgi:hypothetical protein